MESFETHYVNVDVYVGVSGFSPKMAFKKQN